MKKYYSLRAVLAENEAEAVEKVLNGDFDESDPLCDKCVSKDELKRITIEECREIEDKVLEMWHKRANAQGYKPKSKTATHLQAEFMLGMAATLDILNEVGSAGHSMISPRVLFSIMRGDYIV